MRPPPTSKRSEARRAEYEAKAKEQLGGAEGRAAKLDGAEVAIEVNASPEGKLFGSVTPRDVAEALTAKGLEVDKSEVIQAEGPFRVVGEYEVVIVPPRRRAADGQGQGSSARKLRTTRDPETRRRAAPVFVSTATSYPQTYPLNG